MFLTSMLKSRDENSSSPTKEPSQAADA